jgi:putative ABC transport system ATP-binding protein
MAKTVLEAKNITTDFLHDVSFCVRESQMTAIVGPSGSGKSSLLKLVNRLESPKSGHILFHKKNITEYPVTQLRRQIGMVFQESYLFDGTIEENISYGPMLHGMWFKGMEKKLLELVGLPVSFLSRKAGELSGGEKQRVAIARTLANNPKVLLLDEITSALDISSVELIEGLLTTLMKEKEITMMMVTHDLKQAERLSHQTIFISKGKIVEQEETRNIFTHPKTEEMRRFLGNHAYV